MEKQIKYSILVIILFILAFGNIQLLMTLTSKSLNTDSFDNHTFKELKNSDFWTLSPMVIDDTGSGDYTWAQAASQPWCSGAGTQNNPHIIENVTIDASDSGSCLIIRNSNVYFVIRNCSFLNAGPTQFYSGIELINTNYGLIIENYFYHNEEGIRLETSGSNQIEKNNFKTSHYLAIVMENDCDYNKIIDNDINNNYRSIYLIECDYNEIKKNKMNSNTQFGIYCHTSNYNNIIENDINYAGNIGIAFDGSCRDNFISKNNLTHNKYGIYMTSPINEYNTISNNNITDNTIHGILLDSSSSRNNIFHSNNISNNAQNGVVISSSSLNNLLYNNYFSSNGIKHVLDETIGTHFNNSQIGNYWDNYTGYDFNDDGIGDIPHNITLSPLRQDMLPIWDDGDDGTPPVIEIISPIPNQVFGVIAPNFQINIKTLYTNTTWYTINEGAINYTFSGFSRTVNQTTWDTKGNEIITLRFYANDSLGNIGSADVLIQKDLIAPKISINSPTPNQLCGVATPTFSVTVEELYLLTTQYSINGRPNITFTTETQFNYLEWNLAGNGTVIIKFYAIDEAGNINSSQVIVRKDAYIPNITIISPISNEIFGNTAPDFTISIIEDDLVSTWYTIQGNLTQYPFTGSTGTVNQTAWDNELEGSVTITFYAQDKAGNIGFESVVVTKGILPQKGITGYNIFFLIGILSIILILTSKKIKNC